MQCLTQDKTGGGGTKTVTGRPASVIPLRSGNHSSGQSFFVVNLPRGQQIEDFYGDRGLLQGATVRLVWLRFLSVYICPGFDYSSL